MDFRKLMIVLAAMLALGMLAGCGDDDSSSGDGGPDGANDSGTGTDTDTTTSTGEGDWVGTPCEPAPDGGVDPCPELTGASDAQCFSWANAQGGVCTKTCVFATEANMVDGCNMDGVVCMDISGLTGNTDDDAAGYGLCVEKCVPSTSGNECKASYIKCDPQSWSFEAQFSTCLLPGCQDDTGCGVATIECTDDETVCDTANGETCQDDGTGVKYCVFNGTCDTATGRCSWKGDADAKIGDPCKTTSDCGDNMVCFSETLSDEDQDSDTTDFQKAVPRNGMCARQGCGAGNPSAANSSGSQETEIQDRYGCTMFGECAMGFNGGGLCFRRCLPDDSNPSFTCRQPAWGTDKVLDQNGDYDCYDQSAYILPIFAEGGIPAQKFISVSAGPICSYVTAGIAAKCQTYNGGSMTIASTCDDTETCVTCDAYFGSKLGGSSLVSWGQGMTCRNPATGEEQADGYCLDKTTSGPTGHWAWDTDVVPDAGPDAAVDAGDGGK
ncbi:MAG: hypothetical protein PHU25_15885 [Deltaproteobacteria bacterium]|nr:hypothetical protein [Deltaproteobacteria bacterium]